MSRQTDRILNAPVIVGALGYFVDIYDLLLFGIVRQPSLRALGVAEADLLAEGVRLLNFQMVGLLLGGILWGVWGDKRGRVSVLFGSIFLYSTANIANAFVHDTEWYAILRFIAGLGLAGELGAAITLVSETMTKERRGYGTAIVAGVGICGAVVASIVGDAFDWRTAYIVGGVLGFALLILRMKTYESGMFEQSRKENIKRGDLLLLFSSGDRIRRFLSCVLIGLPIWFVIGVLVTFGPELAQELGITGVVTGSNSIMYAYIGLAIGDISSGLISQWWGSRKKVVAAFLALTSLFVLVYVFGAHGWSPFGFYALCAGLGFGTGYWAVFVTNASEQFGTNLRATVATIAPNLVRGAVVPITLGFRALTPSLGMLHAALAVGAVCLVIALIALSQIRDSFGKDLDFFETL